MSEPIPEDKFVGLPKALAELVCDRLASGDEDEHPYFNVIPMRVSNNVLLISLVISGPVTHMTEEGSTEIPVGSAITLVVQEYIEGKGVMDSDAAATQLFDLKEIVR